MSACFVSSVSECEILRFIVFVAISEKDRKENTKCDLIFNE